MSYPRTLAILSFAACCIVGATAAPAQTYPTRTITLIVPFPAGGTTDSIARALGETLSQKLGQQIVIENVGGAGGTIGAARVARAAPDGHTILLHQLGLAAAKTLYPKLPFDPDKDFAGIGLINTAASIMAGRASLPPNNLKELLSWAKEPNRNVTMAHAGVGAFGHLCGVLFAQEIGIKVQQVPYKGGGPALNDLVAGHADLSCLSAAIAGGLIRAGKLKGYGVVGKRFAGLPQVESLVEAGYKNLDLQFWHALFAPAATPRPVIDRLNAVLRESFTNERVRAIFDKNGMELYPAAQQTPEAATAMLRNEIKRWGDVIRANKIEVQQ